MTERRLFAPGLAHVADELTLAAEVARHARVLRLSVGDTVEFFDGCGHTRAGRITALSPTSLSCALTGELRREDRGRPVVLVQCLPKGSKLDEIVRMTTELGLAELRLAHSSRCVARPDEHRSKGQLERLKRIAVEAARQAEQAHVPDIVPAQPLASVLAAAPIDAVKLACVERSDGEWPSLQGPGPVWVVVGPEGGMDAEDLAQLDGAGFLRVGLGRPILRTETAAVVGVAWVMSRILDRQWQHR